MQNKELTLLQKIVSIIIILEFTTVVTLGFIWLIKLLINAIF